VRPFSRREREFVGQQWGGGIFQEDNASVPLLLSNWFWIAQLGKRWGQTTLFPVEKRGLSPN